MRVFAIVAVAVGALAYWRRASLRRDLVHATVASRAAASRASIRLRRDIDESAEFADDDDTRAVTVDGASESSKAGEES